MGVRLRRLREEKGLTQLALAKALELSPSYLNQLENNQRPLTVPVLLKINAVFGTDVQMFSDDEEARLIADLRDALSDTSLGGTVSLAEIRELATAMPAVGRSLVALHRRNRQMLERTEAMLSSLGDDKRSFTALAPPMPYEEVRDFFYAKGNHIPELDEAAEALYAEAGLAPGQVAAGLSTWLQRRHDVRVELTEGDGAPKRSFDPRSKVIRLSPFLRPGQIAFQLATQIAFLEQRQAIEAVTATAALSSDEARHLARLGLAHYFAGALVLPYGRFLREAERLRYDIERLATRFGVGFETVCHRLSTLQRTGARGVPFFLIRVDRAGNISKRQSATDFHFSRVGGTCPLWNVYEAFSTPGKVLTQAARMPDGRTYLWIARTVSRNNGGFGTPAKTFAVALGCDIAHAGRLVYSKGLDLSDPEAAVPIGAGCKVCERPSCAQRAFPPIGRPIAVDENTSRPAPYSVA